MDHSASALVNLLLARGKFRHLQVLLRLAELGSVQRTADVIGLTQSSVTQTLHHLESLLGVKLFERHARGVRPTPAARDLLPIARQLVLGISEGAEAVVARRTCGDGVVRLIGSTTATHGLLACTLPEFSRRYPRIQIHLREAEGEDQLLAIARGEVDLVVCRKPAVEPEGWKFDPVIQDRFLIVCRAEHPLARRREVQWSELSRGTWLLLPTGLGARTRFDALCEQHFDRVADVYPIVTQSLSMLQPLLREHDLLAILPFNFVRSQLRDGSLVEVKAEGELAMDPIGLLQPTESAGQATLVLSEFLRMSCPELGEKSPGPVGTS
ncbi:DNA-binding transcriptional regulator, LysR family [Variovorax sp. HW608]|uniref:LysR family transcriptional regulator n=1 Tax=Variovorax sp. HW608 TaxID=1034889 RepID=UPI00081FF418|nr:LysR family transcriptional regulator [Variovorax sp. HW608]SCK10842.1 DNA-binding transcriptional regulator, LysR family [Variovorax sp. HW608]